MSTSLFLRPTVVVGILLLGLSHVHAATLTVTTLEDSGRGSLRSAITRANRTPAADTIVFARKVRGTLGISSALPDLTGKITIQGPGRDHLNVRRTGKAHYRLFTVTRTGNVKLSGLTLSNGSVVAVTAPTLKRGVGGAISNQGSLELSHCTLTGNQASEGGGAIFNSSDKEVGWGVRIADCVLTNNRCLVSESHGINGGGALLNASNEGDASARMDRCTFSGNVSKNPSDDLHSGDGGAIATGRGSVYIFTTTFSDNVAGGQGGALCSTGKNAAEFTVAQCAFIGNSAFEGGGIYVNSPHQGIFMQNCTLSGNKARQKTGAISSEGGHNLLVGCTIVNNMAPLQAGISVGHQLSVDNCIIAGNLLPSHALGTDVTILPGETTSKRPSEGSGGHNLIGRGDAESLAFFNERGDRCHVTLAELKLAPLANNGGFTRTYALLPGSVAMGNGRYMAMDDPFPDQRGIVRSYIGDIGAYQTVPPKIERSTSKVSR